MKAFFEDQCRVSPERTFGRNFHSCPGSMVQTIQNLETENWSEVTENLPTLDRPAKRSRDP